MLFFTKKLQAIHVWLFAIFPVLFLYDHNKDMAQLSYLQRPLILVTVFSVLVFSGFLIWLKNQNKAALASSLFVVLFFSFGHILPIIGDLTFGNLMIYSHHILIFFLSVLFAGGLSLIYSSKSDFSKVSLYLNTVSLILVAITVFSIGCYEYKNMNVLSADSLRLLNAEFSATDNTDMLLPDIYYIILDGYARADILKNLYGFDNSDFLDFLKGHDFYVASSSHANYAQTYLSVSSTLNLDYLDNLLVDYDERSSDRRKFRNLIRDNKVHKILKQHGYTIVAYPSTWAGYYDNLSSDIYRRTTLDLNEFDNLLLSTTALFAFYRRDILIDLSRKKFFFTLKNLPELAEQSVPTFTYVHLLMPHPPFIFDRHGNSIKPKMNVLGNDGSHYFGGSPSQEELATYRKKYVDQLIFLNGQIKKTIDEILSLSVIPPIIIIQSDHGPGSLTDWENQASTYMPERLSILNAYLLPERAKNNLYHSITPVNTFRIIFNELFDANFELLSDRSYFSTWPRPYEFINVNDRLYNYQVK